MDSVRTESLRACDAIGVCRHWRVMGKRSNRNTVRAISCNLHGMLGKPLNRHGMHVDATRQIEKGMPGKPLNLHGAWREVSVEIQARLSDGNGGWGGGQQAQLGQRAFRVWVLFHIMPSLDWW